MLNDKNVYPGTDVLNQRVGSLSELTYKNSQIDPSLYVELNVKRGLRDLDGTGVLAGLTGISEVCARKTVNGETVPCKGELFYRGVNVDDLTAACLAENRHGFEETVYLLLFGVLPDTNQLSAFKDLLSDFRQLPTSFVRDVIMKAPSRDMMNALSRSVLTLYSYDDKADDLDITNVLRQCIFLISVFPLLSVYLKHSQYLSFH